MPHIEDHLPDGTVIRDPDPALGQYGAAIRRRNRPNPNVGQSLLAPYSEQELGQFGPALQRRFGNAVLQPPPARRHVTAGPLQAPTIVGSGRTRIQSSGGRQQRPPEGMSQNGDTAAVPPRTMSTAQERIMLRKAEKREATGLPPTKQYRGYLAAKKTERDRALGDLRGARDARRRDHSVNTERLRRETKAIEAELVDVTDKAERDEIEKRLDDAHGRVHDAKTNETTALEWERYHPDRESETEKFRRMNPPVPQRGPDDRTPPPTPESPGVIETLVAPVTDLLRGERDIEPEQLATLKAGMGYRGTDALPDYEAIDRQLADDRIMYGTEPGGLLPESFATTPVAPDAPAPAAPIGAPDTPEIEITSSSFPRDAVFVAIDDNGSPIEDASLTWAEIIDISRQPPFNSDIDAVLDFYALIPAS